MAGETVITFTGNVVADPELRFTPSGAPVANFRVANTPAPSSATPTSGRTATPYSSACPCGANRPRTSPSPSSAATA